MAHAETSTATRYGELYWCAKVTKDISPDGEIYVFADSVKTVDGTLQFIGHFSQEQETAFPVLIIPAGKWLASFAASVLDGAAIAVEHWQGEVVR